MLLTRTKIEESERENGLGFDLVKNKLAAVVALLIIVGGFYIFQVNQLSVLGYKIKESEKEAKILQKETVQLQLEVEKMKTASNLHEKIQGLNMVESKQIGYIYTSDSSMAFASNDLRY